MTNGEKIQTILDIDRDCTEVHGENGTMTFTVTQDFWNAEYTEPTTKNDLVVDCISRDVVKNYIQAHIHEIITESGEDKNKHTNRVLRSLIHGVDCMPSITPLEPKKGHWINYDCDEDKYDKIKCSECGHIFIVDSYHWCDIGFTKDDLKYCPNCGAKMVEPQESEDK